MNLATGALVGLALVLPLVAAAEEGEFVLSGGIPLRLAGNVQARAPEATLVLQGDAPPTFRLNHEGAALVVQRLHSEYSDLPAGGRMRMVSTVSAEETPLAPGTIGLASTGSSFYAVADGEDLVMASDAQLPPAQDAWTRANFQFTTLMAPRELGAAHLDATALPNDAVAQVVPMTLDAGSFEARSDSASTRMDVARLVLHDATLRIGAATVGTLIQRTEAPGGTYLGAQGGWTGPGTHVVEEITLLTLVLKDATLSVTSSPRASATAYASSMLLQLDGYAQFPWAVGNVRDDGKTTRVDGDQILLHGAIALRPLGFDPAKNAVTYLGSGSLIAVEVGPVDAGPSPAAAAIIAGGATTIALGAAATVYYWPLLKVGFTSLFLPLYARLPRDKVLEHKGRSVVYDLIRQEAGVSTHQLAQAVDFGWSTLMYHLRVLERTEKIVSVRDGRYKRFFDRESGRYANGRKVVVATLKNEVTLAIGRLVLENPGITQKDLSGRLGLAPSSIHWHVERLAEAGLLEKRRDGHHVRYYPGPAWKEVPPEDVGLPATLLVPLQPGAPAAAAASAVPPLPAPATAAMAMGPGPGLGPLQ